MYYNHHLTPTTQQIPKHTNDPSLNEYFMIAHMHANECACMVIQHNPPQKESGFIETYLILTVFLRTSGEVSF